jgi:hypothetical protein
VAGLESLGRGIFLHGHATCLRIYKELYYVRPRPLLASLCRARNYCCGSVWSENVERVQQRQQWTGGRRKGRLRGGPLASGGLLTAARSQCGCIRRARA